MTFAPDRFDEAPAWAPAFWKMATEDGIGIDVVDDEKDAVVTYLAVEAEERRLYPELTGVAYVALYRDQAGMVHGFTACDVPDET